MSTVIYLTGLVFIALGAATEVKDASVFFVIVGGGLMLLAIIRSIEA